MDAFSTVRADLSATLAAAGVENVTTDPRLEAPGVLVDAPSTIDPGNSGATWTLVVPVRVLAPPPGDAAALDWLLATVELVLLTLGPDAVSARAGTYPLLDKDHPAYLLDVTRTLPVPC